MLPPSLSHSATVLTRHATRHGLALSPLTSRLSPVSRLPHHCLLCMHQLTAECQHLPLVCAPHPNASGTRMAMFRSLTRTALHSGQKLKQSMLPNSSFPLSGQKIKKSMSLSDTNVQQSLRNISAARKTEFPWTRGEPYSQPYFSFDPARHLWLSSSSSSSPDSAKSSLSDSSPSLTRTPARITLLTWNIDFMLPLTRARMSAALSHLEEYLATSVSSSTPTVIFLQEMLQSDLRLLQSSPWVCHHYVMTDVDDTYWEGGFYGTCTLVDKRLEIKDVFRVHFAETRFERDGLFVDVVLAASDTAASNNSNDNSSSSHPPATTLSVPILRFCNTHLESLVSHPPLRPLQLSALSKFLHPPFPSSYPITASLLAGDLNAIEPFDRTLHSLNNLRDAYLELGGQEDHPDGYTWGQQAKTSLRESYGCTRMDKILFCGEGVVVERLERFGIDVQVEAMEHRERLKREGLDKGWVSDHLGVRADFIFQNR